MALIWREQYSLASHASIPLYSPVFSCIPRIPLYSSVFACIPLYSPVFPCIPLYCPSFPCIPMYSPVFTCISMYSSAFLSIPLFPVFPCIPLYSSVFPSIRLYSRLFSGTPLYSPVFLCIPVRSPSPGASISHTKSERQPMPRLSFLELFPANVCLRCGLHMAEINVERRKNGREKRTKDVGLRFGCHFFQR